MNNTFYSNHLFTTLPAQKIPLSEKNEEWKQACVQAICSMGAGRTQNGRSRWAKKQVNYDFVNSVINEDDFNYVLNPYGVKDKVGSQPARMRAMNLVIDKLSVLKGEEIATRPFNYQVIAVNGEAIQEKENQKKQQLIQYIEQQLASELGIDLTQINPETGEETQQQLQSLLAYGNYDIRDIREKWGNDILEYLKYKENLPLKFNEGWEHALICAEEIYYIGIKNGQPSVRTCNPLNCEFDRNPDNPNIQDGDWFKEDRWMTRGQILDEFGDYLSDEDITRLDQANIAQGLSNQMFPGFAYTETDIKGYNMGNFPNRTKATSTHYLVTHTVWKSMKRIGFLYQNGEEIGIVDETFKLTPDLKAEGIKVEWEWISDIWHGTRIASDIFVQIEQVPNQIRSIDNIREVKLPYVGRVYNSLNSEQNSFVDMIKPHIYLYMIVWFRLEAELAKAKGKKMVMDIAQIPKSQGFDLDKWMYFFDNAGLALINSFEEGQGKFQNQISAFNQFQSIDMTVSQSIGQYITILDKIERVIAQITGISPQREGAVHQSETVGGVERAVAQSSIITEHLFYIHNEVKKEVLTQLLECAKFAYPNQKKLNYIVDDVQRISVTIDMEKFADSDYGIFVSNSSKDYLTFQKLETLASQALASGAATMSDMIAIYKAKSINEVSKLIQASEERKQQQEQQQLQMQQQMQQQNLQAQAQEKQADRNFTAEQNQLNREARLKEAAIKAMGFDTDTNDSGEIEAIKYSEIAIKEMDTINKHNNEQAKMQHESLEKAKDRALKEKEIQSKERIENKKASIALKNKVVGEK